MHELRLLAVAAFFSLGCGANLDVASFDAGCAPRTCLGAGKNCGQLPDGCRGVLDCGACPGTQSCGGGGLANVCGAPPCTPQVCATLGLSCGTASDGCGAMLDCGSCQAPQTCGGGGTPGRYGCAPETDAAFCSRLGKNCGAVTGFDRCGASRTVNCGTCSGANTCGGGGQANVCGVDRCAGVVCSTPPTNFCRANSNAELVATRYQAQGTCDRSTGQCRYTSMTETCDEDCRGGVCVSTPCTLRGFECTTPETGCKLLTPTTLRCLPIGSSPVREGFAVCDERIPEQVNNSRCASDLRCVRPPNYTASVCAVMCLTNADCLGVGLMRQQTCVPTSTSTYGYCR
ncbi:MAG: hypothetical protein MUC96_07290 [Myxococcaceae bacterium]|nr:hypothetical protein [Myxococcaceae bacterium]